MTQNNLTALSPAETEARRSNGAVLIDIREPDEFTRRHIHGAISQPLSNWEQAHLTITPGQDVIFTCRSGMRTSAACTRLETRLDGDTNNLDGGLNGWEKAGLPIEVDVNAPLEIMRQVQISAGLLMLFGIALGLAVSPFWLGLSAFVGAGLTFAGITGFCGMARLLMLAPWNRRKAEPY